MHLQFTDLDEIGLFTFYRQQFEQEQQRRNRDYHPTPPLPKAVYRPKRSLKQRSQLPSCYAVPFSPPQPAALQSVPISTIRPRLALVRPPPCHPLSHSSLSHCSKELNEYVHGKAMKAFKLRRPRYESALDNRIFSDRMMFSVDLTMNRIKQRGGQQQQSNVEIGVGKYLPRKQRSKAVMEAMNCRNLGQIRRLRESLEGDLRTHRSPVPK